MNIPAFEDARADKALRGNPMTVYLKMLERLHTNVWRDVPQLALCQELDLGERTVRDALNVLVEQGYLERDDATAATNHSRRYRLVYSRPPRAE